MTYFDRECETYKSFIIFIKKSPFSGYADLQKKNRKLYFYSNNTLYSIKVIEEKYFQFTGGKKGAISKAIS